MVGRRSVLKPSPIGDGTSGLVLAFPFHAASAVRRAEPVRGPCTILLFTGVRYESHGEPADAGQRGPMQPASQRTSQSQV